MGMAGSTRGGASPNNRRRLYLIWRHGTSPSRRCGRWLDEDRRPSAARSTPCVPRLLQLARKHDGSARARLGGGTRRRGRRRPRRRRACLELLPDVFDATPPKTADAAFWRPWTPRRAARRYVGSRGSAARGRLPNCVRNARRCCRRRGGFCSAPGADVRKAAAPRSGGRVPGIGRRRRAEVRRPAGAPGAARRDDAAPRGAIGGLVFEGRLSRHARDWTGVCAAPCAWRVL